MALVSVVDVHKYHGTGEARVEVLRGVNLEVKSGEFVSLMGASGSGKTTLLNLVGGLDIPSQGKIQVMDTEFGMQSDRERSLFRLKHMGFVFQSFNLIPNLTAIENVCVPLYFLGHGTNSAQELALKAMKEVGLSGKERRGINQLSGGERQRVAVARAVVHSPRLILADEPTGNLDSKTGHQILELLQSLISQHKMTIVMATHDYKAADYAHRTVFVQDGLVVDSLNTPTGSIA